MGWFFFHAGQTRMCFDRYLNWGWGWRAVGLV